MCKINCSALLALRSTHFKGQFSWTWKMWISLRIQLSLVYWLGLLLRFSSNFYRPFELTSRGQKLKKQNVIHSRALITVSLLHLYCMRFWRTVRHNEQLHFKTQHTAQAQMYSQQQFQLPFVYSVVVFKKVKQRLSCLKSKRHRRI